MCFLDAFHHKQSDSYFDQIKRAIEKSRREVTKYVFFVDPDTGVREKAGPEHVTPNQLAALWESLQPGDTLLIYQHYARVEAPKWLSDQKSLIARAMDPAPEIRDRRHSGVCFFIADKPNHSCD